MKSIPALLERAIAKATAKGTGRAPFLKGYEVSARDSVSLLLQLCYEDIEVEYTGIITMKKLEKLGEQLLK